MEPQKEYLTPNDLFNLLGIPETTQKVWRYQSKKGVATDKPGIPFLKVGRCVRYRRADIENWIKKQQPNDDKT